MSKPWAGLNILIPLSCVIFQDFFLWAPLKVEIRYKKWPSPKDVSKSALLDCECNAPSFRAVSKVAPLSSTRHTKGDLYARILNLEHFSATLNSAENVNPRMKIVLDDSFNDKSNSSWR